MTWVTKECPVIPSLEHYPPDKAKRFTDMKLCNTLICRSGWIRKYMELYEIKTDRDAIEWVIKNIDYPLIWGFIPTDRHVWNAFNGKACYVLELDYWQTAWETLMTYILNKRIKGTHGYGDCEDTAILTASMLRLLDVPAYVCFGVVYENKTMLGGHGWTIAQLSDGKWHLIETTLDVPPKYPDGYPVIDPNEEDWFITLQTPNGPVQLEYEALVKFNEKEYYESTKALQERLGVDEVPEVEELARKYSLFHMYAIAFDKKKKHSRKKVKRIKEVWHSAINNGRKD